MQSYDFLAENLVIELPTPFNYEKVRITAVKLRKLYAPDITKLKSIISSIPDKLSDRLKYMMYAKEISHSCVECFIDEKGEDITTVSNKLLVEKCTPQNTYKIMLFATMLTVEKSLVTTSYKCSSCGKFTLFDLDPSQEIPKNIEQERWYMQDFLSYIKEKINKTGSDTFEHVLRSPVILKNDKNDSSVTIYRMTFTYPTIEDYTKCLKDTKRKDAVDLWVLFDNLERINDFSIPDTQNIKDKYGFDKIFRLKTVELQDIVDRLNEYGVMQNHSYTCRTCGSVETVPFDMTNFFDFLRMS